MITYYRLDFEIIILLPAGTTIVLPVGYMDQPTGLLHLSYRHVWPAPDLLAVTLDLNNDAVSSRGFWENINQWQTSNCLTFHTLNLKLG